MILPLDIEWGSGYVTHRRGERLAGGTASGLAPGEHTAGEVGLGGRPVEDPQGDVGRLERGVQRHQRLHRRRNEIGQRFADGDIRRRGKLRSGSGEAVG